MTLQEIDKRLSQIPNYCYYLAEHRVNDHVLHLNFDRWYQLGNEFNRNAWIYTYGTERQSGRTLAMARNIVIRLSDVIAGNLDCVRVVVFPYLMAHYKTAIRYVLSQSEDFLHDKNRNITFKGKVVIRFYFKAHLEGCIVRTQFSLLTKFIMTTNEKGNRSRLMN
jgi:hypothetical protein